MFVNMVLEENQVVYAMRNEGGRAKLLAGNAYDGAATLTVAAYEKEYGTISWCKKENDNEQRTEKDQERTGCEIKKGSIVVEAYTEGDCPQMQLGNDRPDSEGS